MNQSLPKLVVLVSGFGSNLQSIINHIQSGELKASIVGVIANRPYAQALERAEKASIRTSVILPDDFSNRQQYDQALVQEVKKLGADWIVLAGFMRILSPAFLIQFPQKVINIHPSLLPKYPGLHAIEQALSNGDSETGVTVHYVNEGVDTGPVILQDSVAIGSEDTIESLKAKIQALEHQIYPKALQKVLWGK